MDDAPLLLDISRLLWRRWTGRQPTGIDRVCLAYLEHFGHRAQAVVHHRRFRGILGWAASSNLFSLLEDPPKNFRSSLVQTILRQLRPTRRRGRNRLYLNLGHTGLDTDGFRRWVSEAGVRPIYFVHDLIPLTHPEFCRAGEAERHRNRMRTVLSTGSGVIGNSQATIDDLHHFAVAEALPFPPAIPAWLGSTRMVHPPTLANEPERATFVVLGTIEARKNHLMLLNIWSRLIKRSGTQAPRLLVIGQRGWEAEQVFTKLDSQMFRGHVIELNCCRDDELHMHLASARALLFPSSAEGYGLPLIEALGLGVPAIASDLPVFREIGQGVPLLLESRDEAAWEAAILDFAQPTSAAREEQLRRLKSFHPPTWTDHFEAVEQWLSAIHSVPTAPRLIR